MKKILSVKPLFILLFILQGKLFAQDNICKLQVGGVTVATPIVTGENSYVIRVYIPNPDKIVAAEVDAQSIKATVSSITNYTDNTNPCNSYMTVYLEINATRPLGMRLVTLYKLNSAGGRVIAATFNFEVRPGFSISSAVLRNMDNTRPVSFYYGRKYKLTLTGERLLMMQMKEDPLLMVALRELTTASQNERNFEVVFKQTLYGNSPGELKVTEVSCISLPIIGDGKSQRGSIPLTLILRPYSIFDNRNEDWTSGAFYGSKFNAFADVTGDGKPDALKVTSTEIWVGRSNGAVFNSKELWMSAGFVERSLHTADVTGDGKADFIAVLNSQVIVFKSMPEGFSRFGTRENWTEGAYYGDKGTFFADVTGDGKADAIVVNNGNVVVRRSTGTSFSANENWTDNPYYGEKGTFFADVTGDGKADAIVVNNGNIVVRRSTGSRFSANENWTTNAYYGSRGTYFADIDADRKADAIVVNDWGVTIRRSGGSSFLEPIVGTREAFYGQYGTYFCDLDGDGKAEAIAINSDGTFIRRPLLFFF